MRVWPGLWLLFAWHAHAETDGIHRCIGPDGVSIYTDRPCDEFGAKDRIEAPPQDPEPSPQDSGFTRTDCARQTDTLLFDMRQAIEADNVNQLAGLYHWPGVGRRSAVGIMNRLERLTSRPLAAVELVFPEVTPLFDDPLAALEGVPPEGAPSEDPIGVRIEQSMPGEITPSFVEFLRLVRHAECWWVSF